MDINCVTACVQLMMQLRSSWNAHSGRLMSHGWSLQHPVLIRPVSWHGIQVDFRGEARFHSRPLRLLWYDQLQLLLSCSSAESQLNLDWSHLFWTNEIPALSSLLGLQLVALRSAGNFPASPRKEGTSHNKLESSSGLASQARVNP